MGKNKKLCLVTYIRKNEIFTKELDLSKEEKINPQWTWKKN